MFAGACPSPPRTGGGVDLHQLKPTVAVRRLHHRVLAEITAPELDVFLHENVRASILLVKEFAAQHDERPGGRVS
jgi:hypothetical protein